MKLFSLSILSSVLLLSSNASPLAPLEERTIEKRSSPPPTNSAFKQNVLTYVNGIRSRHAAPPLTWDASLASYALRKSNGCKLDHNVCFSSTCWYSSLSDNAFKTPYGENAYNFWYTPPNTPPDFTAKVREAFNWWIRPAEVNAYRAGNLPGAYHFTQTVWKASNKIGCAFSTDRCTRNPRQDWWFYCEFSPRGNDPRYYRGNVTV